MACMHSTDNSGAPLNNINTFWLWLVHVYSNVPSV